MITFLNIEQAFERLNTLLDASGALESPAILRAVYQLRLEIVRSLGDAERIRAAELSLQSLGEASGDGQVCAELSEPHDLARRLANDEYIISRLVTAKYLTYDVDGDEVVFDEALRADVEQLLGCQLEEFTSTRYAGEVGLRIPPSKMAGARQRLSAFAVESAASDGSDA